MKFNYTLDRESGPLKLLCEAGGETPSAANGFTGELVVDILEPADLIVTTEEWDAIVAEANKRLR